MGKMHANRLAAAGLTRDWVCMIFRLGMFCFA